MRVQDPSQQVTAQWKTHRLEINIGRFRRRGDTTAAAVVVVVAVAVVRSTAAGAAAGT